MSEADQQVADGKPAGESDRLVEALYGHLTHSLGSHLLPADRERDGPNWRVDWPLTAGVIPLLCIASLAVFFVAQPDGGRRVQYVELIFLQVWGSGFLWMVTWVAWRKKHSILGAVKALSAVVSDESKAEIASRFEGARWRRGQWVIVGVATVAYCTVAGIAMAHDLGYVGGVGSFADKQPLVVSLFWMWFLSYVLAFVLAIKLGLAATFYRELVVGFKVRDLASHPLTPDEAPVVQQTLRIGSEMLGLALVTALYMVTLLLWAHDLKWFVVTHLSFTLATSLGTGVFLYWEANRRLEALIRERRAITLDGLEKELWQSYSSRGKQSDWPPGAFKTLLDLHGKVAARTPRLASREVAKIALPVLPQLLALAWATEPELLKLLPDVFGRLIDVS